MVHHSVCGVLPCAVTPAGVLAEAPLREAHRITVSRADQRLRSQQGIVGVEVLQSRSLSGTLLGGRGGRGRGRSPRVAAQAAVLAALKHPAGLEMRP